MSRIGKQPIAVPKGVEVKIEGTNVSVKGPKGETSRLFNKEMIIKLDNSTITVERPTDNKEHRSLHGLTRSSWPHAKRVAGSRFRPGCCVA